MSGVRSGPRLDHLRTLERKVRHEIDAARRREDLDELRRLLVLRERVEAAIHDEGGQPAPRPQAAPRTSPSLSAVRRATDTRKANRLDQLGVTTRDVKVWAVSNGLLDGVHRGRVADHLVEAYAAAHPPPSPDPTGAHR